MRAPRFRAGRERTARPREALAAGADALRSAAQVRIFDGAVGPAIGRGGSSQVLRGSLPSGGLVALKTLKPDLARDPRAVLALEHEARMLALVRHSHVVGCRGIVRLADGRLALELDYLGGGDLVSLAGGRPAVWAEAALAVAAALAHCHAQGVVHGDVKARNVLFADDGTPRLVDFASARLLAAGASPESDVRAFAALLYELLAGAPPPGSGEPPAPPAAAEDAAAGRVFAAAAGVLEGRLPARLFALADVLESARRP